VLHTVLQVNHWWMLVLNSHGEMRGATNCAKLALSHSVDAKARNTKAAQV